MNMSEIYFSFFSIFFGMPHKLEGVVGKKCRINWKHVMPHRLEMHATYSGRR